MNRGGNHASAYITGLSHEYPAHTVLQQDFEPIVKSLYPLYKESIGYVSFDH